MRTLEETMNKWSVLILFTIVLGLSACGGDDKKGPTSAATPNTTPSCNNFYWNGWDYVDNNGNVVDCTESNDGWNQAGWHQNSCMNYRYHQNGYFVDSHGSRVNCQQDIIDFSQVYPYPGSWGTNVSCAYWGAQFNLVNMFGVYVCSAQTTVSWPGINENGFGYYGYGYFGSPAPSLGCRVGVDDCGCGGVYYGGTLSLGGKCP